MLTRGTKMLLHLNDTVQVKLTDRGRSILKQKASQELMKVEDADGWSSWVLWDLMNTFGNFLTPGQEEPFHSRIKFLDSAMSD
jgi:hypothetical protein